MSTNNEFTMNVNALLDRQRTISQINSDIKELERAIHKIKIVGTIAKGSTQNELNEVIRQMEAQLRHVKLQARMDSRQLNREINDALRNATARDIRFNLDGGRLNAQVRQMVSQAREIVDRSPLHINVDLKKEKLMNQLTAFVNKNSKINESSFWLGEVERLRTVIDAVSDPTQLRNATDQFQVFTSGVRATGFAAVSTSDKIKNMLGKIVQVGNYFGLAFVAVNKFRQSLSTLKGNDTILTEISKTSEMTKQQLAELGDEAFRVASKYGQLSNNYLAGVREMARSGYEGLSKELGELSLLAQSAGDMTADNANNYLLATDAAYKYGGSVEKLNTALDGANYISNKNSASLTDISDAISVSASFAANAGVEIDKLTAAEATMIATTKRSGSEMGRAFRSILLNLQQVSGEFDGETIDEEQLKKVEDRCHSLGVELEYIKDGVATLRNPMEVLKELSEIYNSLPDNSAEKQGLIADIGGKYHANALSSLLSRWDLYEKMLDEFSQGTGSALEEANKTADSWEGRLAQLQNSWDEFVNSLTSKNAIKGGISILDNTIQAFQKLTDAIGAIPVLMTTVNASMAALNKNYGITQIFNKDTRKIDVQGSFMGMNITAFKQQQRSFREAEIAIRGWNERLIAGTENIDTFGGALVQNNAQLKAYLATTSVDAPASLSGYKAHLNAAGVSTDALRLKTMLMTSVMSMGLSFAIQGAITIISKLVHMQEEARQNAESTTKEAIQNYESISSEVENLESKIKEFNEQVNGLDPITDEEAVNNLKAETEELKLQLAILKEKQRISSSDADKAAQKSLEMTQPSRYKKVTYESAYGGIEEGRAYVTKDEELVNAIEAYEKYKQKVDNAKQSLASLAQRSEAGVNYSQKEWDAQNKVVSEYSQKMEDARVHANELATELELEKEGLNGATEESQHLIEKTDYAIGAYNGFLNSINGVTDALQEESQAMNETSDTPKWNYTETIEGLGKVQEKLSVLDKSYAKLFDKDESIGFEDYSSILDAFKDVEGLNIDTYLQQLQAAGQDAGQVKSAMENLITEYLKLSGVLDNVTDSNHNLVASMLEEMGIENANEIVTAQLAAQHLYLKLNTEEGADAIFQQVNALIQEEEATGLTCAALFDLIAQQQIFNASGLDVGSKIAQLEQLAGAFGIAADSARSAQAYLDAARFAGSYGGKDAADAVAKDMENYYQSKIAEKFGSLGSSYKGGSGTKKAADKSSKKDKEKEVDIMAELNAEMDKYQSKLKAVKEARETYNEYGKITVDQAQDIVDADFKLLAAYGDEQSALESLGKAKLNEMQIQLARNAIDTINKIQSEAEATEYLAGANEHLAGASKDVTERMLQEAVAAAKVRGELQGQAADTILKGYQNGAMMLGQVDFGFDLDAAKKAKEDAEKESEKQFEKQYNWIDRLLDKFSRITDKWRSSVDKFTSWWNKNWSLDKAIRSNRKEIEANVDAYNYYNKKAKKVGLSKKYRDLVDNGKISIQDIHDEKLAEKIDKYIEWKDKMRDCIDTIEELYDAEREMIRQKFDNMMEYYDTVNTKVQSIVSKVNSLFDLNEARGKRTDINDLLEKFNGYSDIIGTTTSTTDGDSGANIKQHLLSDEEVAEINKEIEHQESSIYDTATYKKLLNDIEKLETEKARKGEKFSKAKEKKLQNYYKKQKALEQNATADTVTSYAKIYDAYLKLQNKLDAGKSLTKDQRVKYNDYVKQLEEYSSDHSKSIADLKKKLADNVETSSVEAVEKAYDDQKKEVEDSYKRQIEDVKGDVQGTKQYQNLIAQRDNLKKNIADLTAKKEAGTIKKSENKRLEKYLKQLDALDAKIAAIDEGATSENISDYIKAYDRLVKLQSKKKLTEKEAAEYDNLTAQLKAWNTEKQDILESLNRQLADAMEELDAAQLEAVNETTADIAKSQQEAYEIAKQIAELQVSTLENELALIDSALSKIEKRLDLYKKFSADALKDLGYLDADDTSTQDDLYASTFASLIEEQTKKRENLLGQKDIYEKLIDAVANHDYDKIKEMYKDGVFEKYGDAFDKVVEMLNDNTFDGFSATWVDEWMQSLDKVESEIYDLDMSLQDLKDQFREEVTFKAINDAIEKLGYLKDVVKDTSGLIDDELLYDADGSFSEFGTAKVATLVEQLELAQQLAYEYAKKIAIAQADTSYASDKDKEAAIQELEKSYNQQLLEAKGYSDSIVSLYKNQAKQEVDALKNIIAKRKEALQAKKDYYDYDKSIKSKTKDIEAIQAQIAALTGIDSAEARARKAQLESDLADLNDELDEMKKEHEYTLQINALDDFSDKLSESLENVAKDAVEILKEQKGIIDSATTLYQQSSDMIQNTIDTLAKFYGGNGVDLGNTIGITPITDKSSDMNASSIGLGEGIREARPGEGLGLSEEAYEKACEKLKSLMPFNVSDSQSYVMLDSMQNLMHENNAMVRNAVDAMQNKNMPPVVNLHYDNLLYVEGNIDRDFSSILPNYLEKGCEYTLNRLRQNLYTLGWRK